ncbi:hypothetical protein NKH10_25480 [Mesorhizobium sp. M1340]|uniref:hypothetical protein n=1 Tax=Mesorhizobium sp. M1340 TaxID=2957087 RepID=UPI003337CD64
MILRLKERLGKRFEEEVQFFKGWQKDKKGVGALVPTSIYAARRMASVVNPRSGLSILELGGRPLIQITYGPLSPVIKTPDHYVVSHYDFVVRNIPPAQLWTYRRAV